MSGMMCPLQLSGLFNPLVATDTARQRIIVTTYLFDVALTHVSKLFELEESEFIERRLERWANAAYFLQVIFLFGAVVWVFPRAAYCHGNV